MWASAKRESFIREMLCFIEFAKVSGYTVCRNDSYLIRSQVVLETEVTNKVALSLYENLGFIRERYLHQYYLNGVDAYRLKLWLRII